MASDFETALRLVDAVGSYVELDQYKDYSGVNLGLFWEYVGFILGLFWDYFGE